MSTLKIATWNINSVRLRAPQVADFAKMADPDVICLQEIKCRNEEFPVKAFEEMGYPHIHVTGQKGMHGVATVSRHPIEALPNAEVCSKAEARAQSVKIKGIEIQNYYIPAGGDEPDAEINPRFAHKLDFLERLEAYFADRAQNPTPMVVVGDLNIAPYEHDVWSHKQLLKVISHTPIETEGLERIRKAGGFIDAARALIPEPEKLYTWWSYRSKDFRASNRGRRLDHIWVTEPLRDAALKGGREAYQIWDSCREWEKPSDHAPVTLTLQL